MKLTKKIILSALTSLVLVTLAACSSNASSGGNSNSGTQDTTQQSSDTTDSSSSASSSSDLSQNAVYNYLLNAGYTGVGTMPANYDGLNNAVQSQSSNYVLIGQVNDVNALKKALPQFNNTDFTVQNGDWVFYTAVKVGTLGSISDIKNIQ